MAGRGREGGRDRGGCRRRSGSGIADSVAEWERERNETLECGWRRGQAGVSSKGPTALSSFDTTEILKMLGARSGKCTVVLPSPMLIVIVVRKSLDL